MATTRDTFMTFGELLEALAGNSRRALDALEQRELPDGDRFASLVGWVCDRQRRLLDGLDGLARRGPEALRERYLQYMPDPGPSGHGVAPEAVFIWTLDTNNFTLEVLGDLQHKTLAPDTEDTIADLRRQLGAINRKIAMALNTVNDV